jgi:hypothetical protein
MQCKKLCNGINMKHCRSKLKKITSLDCPMPRQPNKSHEQSAIAPLFPDQQTARRKNACLKIAPSPEHGNSPTPADHFR